MTAEAQGHWVFVYTIEVEPPAEMNHTFPPHDDGFTPLPLLPHAGEVAQRVLATLKADGFAASMCFVRNDTRWTMRKAAHAVRN